MRRALTLAVAAVAALAIGTGALNAQDKPLAIGSPCPNFQGLEATDGKSYSLADFKDKDALIVCITCNHCPVAVAVEDRLIEFSKKYAGPDSKVGFIAINVNNLEQDRLPKMKERAKEKGFNFAYAYDPSQQIGRQLGAKVTPEFFVFDKNRKLVYHGLMDNSPNNPNAVNAHYLADAVEATLKGEEVKTAKTRPQGCGIKYEQP
jgi:peroxiredoxin